MEDTYFSDDSHLDREAIRAGVTDYLREMGFENYTVVREEAGVLPLPYANTFTPVKSGPLVAGYQGGWFHPVTGYSFPLAVRLAIFIAGRSVDSLFSREIQRMARRHQMQLRFSYFLNYMLYRWFAPRERWNVLERFYRLPEATIRRFYALNLTVRDCLRIIVGRPPRGISWYAVLTGRKAT